MSDSHEGGEQRDLDLSNCRCSRNHTCDWCLEHRDELLSDGDE